MPASPRLLLALCLFAASACAEENLRPADPELERLVRAVWLTGGNRRPVCASPSSGMPDQQGVQEIQLAFVPGQWVMRLARTSRRAQEIERYDYFWKLGLLERKEAYINIGPLQGLPAFEYRPTAAGWVQSMSRSQHPCFYFGTTQLLKVIGYTESAADSAGFSKVTVHFMRGAEPEVAWASTETAARLFPAVREGLEGRRGLFQFDRAPDGKLRTYPGNPQSIDQLVPTPPGDLPGLDIARESIERTRSVPKPSQSQGLPAACFALMSKHMPQLWKEGDTGSAYQAVLTIPEASGSARSVAIYAYARLRRLMQAGLVALKGESELSRQIVVVPAPAIRPLLAKYGNCLPLGKVRTEVVGIQLDDYPMTRQRFKARYIVEQPAPWIKTVKVPVLADLATILRDGQFFEGVTLKTAEGWTAGYLEDLRPTPALASLSAVGISPDWPNASEARLQGASVVDHELHVVSTYGAATKLTGGRQMGRVEVRVRKSERPMLVLLNGYEPIEWTFRLDAGARVDAVLAIGYYEPRVTGVPRTTATVVAYPMDGATRADPSLTQVGTLGSDAVLARLGVQPTAVKKFDQTTSVVLGDGMGGRK